MVKTMAKFKNKKTGKIVEEHLLFYVNKMRSNPNFEEIKEKAPKEKEKVQETKEVEDKPLQ